MNKTMILVISELEYEALDNALRFVLDCMDDNEDKEYQRILEGTKQLLNKAEMLKEVYN